MYHWCGQCGDKGYTAVERGHGYACEGGKEGQAFEEVGAELVA